MKLTILIIEDETLLAESHAQFIQHYFKPANIWIAGDLAQGRAMITRFNPNLILLDNYLPDGLGIDLLRELTLSHYQGGVIIATAANDIHLVADALRAGAFDYLIKPIAYDRLKQTITRYQQRHALLTDASRVNQVTIDRMFNTYARLDKANKVQQGIDEQTLDKIIMALKGSKQPHTVESIATLFTLSRTTARRYLEHGVTLQQLVATIIPGKVGRPQRSYRHIDDLQP